MKKKKVKTVLIIFFIVLVLVFFMLVWFLASFAMTGKRQTLEEAMQWQSEHYDTSFYQPLEKEDYTVASEDGYALHVQLLKNPEITTKYVILSHGYTDNRMGSLKYVRMYLDLGYSCIIYDLRGHGENESTFTTYGIREGKDIAALVKDTHERYPELTELGLHGESLGAASTISSLQYNSEVSFAVADCGFSDIENVLRNGYASVHLPTVLFDLADLGARLRYHYSLKQMRPIDALDDNNIPVLFIHGENDSFILPRNSIDMYERTGGVKKLQIISEAGHAQSVLVNPEEYRETVEEFLAGI